MPSFTAILPLLILVASPALASPIVGRSNEAQCMWDDFTITRLEAEKMMTTKMYPDAVQTKKELFEAFLRDCCKNSPSPQTLNEGDIRQAEKTPITLPVDPSTEQKKSSKPTDAEIDINAADGQRNGNAPIALPFDPPTGQTNSKSSTDVKAETDASTNSKQGGNNVPIRLPVDPSTEQNNNNNKPTDVEVDVNPTANQRNGNAPIALPLDPPTDQTNSKSSTDVKAETDASTNSKKGGNNVPITLPVDPSAEQKNNNKPTDVEVDVNPTASQRNGNNAPITLPLDSSTAQKNGKPTDAEVEIIPADGQRKDNSLPITLPLDPSTAQKNSKSSTDVKAETDTSTNSKKDGKFTAPASTQSNADSSSNLKLNAIKFSSTIPKPSQSSNEAVSINDLIQLENLGDTSKQGESVKAEDKQSNNAVASVGRESGNLEGSTTLVVPQQKDGKNIEDALKKADGCSSKA